MDQFNQYYKYNVNVSGAMPTDYQNNTYLDQHGQAHHYDSQWHAPPGSYNAISVTLVQQSSNPSLTFSAPPQQPYYNQDALQMSQQFQYNQWSPQYSMMQQVSNNVMPQTQNFCPPIHVNSTDAGTVASGELQFTNYVTTTVAYNQLPQYSSVMSMQQPTNCMPQGQNFDQLSYQNTGNADFMAPNQRHSPSYSTFATGSSSSSETSPSSPSNHSPASHCTQSSRQFTSPNQTASTSGFYDGSNSSSPSSETLPQETVPLLTKVPATATKMTKAVMERYYANPDMYKCTVLIKSPTLVFKSYPKEKRLVTPGPIVSLYDAGWTNNEYMPVHKKMSSLKVSMAFTNDTMSMTAMDPMSNPTMKSNEYNYQAKIWNDRNDPYTKLYTEIDVGTNYNFGKVASQRLDIRTKPTTKRQTTLEVTDDADCDSQWITNGDTIALYSRVLNNFKTIHFHVNKEGTFEVDQNHWSVFEIVVIRSFDEPSGNDIVDVNGITVAERIDKKYVQYGDTVVLYDTITGASLTPAVIRKVELKSDSHVASRASGEVIHPLHMVAFEFYDSDNKPVYLQADGKQLTVAANGKNLPDTSKWTIINANQIECTFAPMVEIPTKPIAPFPEAYYIQPDGEGSFQVIGDNIDESFTVWMGVLQAPVTEHVKLDEKSRLCATIPAVEDYRIYKPQQLVPITLVRDDGLIYETEFYMQYNYTAHTRFDKVRFIRQCDIEDPKSHIF